MLGLAGALGCSNTDANCLCNNPDFGYGIRDCSNAACGPDVASSVIAFGEGYCSCRSTHANVPGHRTDFLQAAKAAAGGATTTATTLVTSATGTVTTTEICRLVDQDLDPDLRPPPLPLAPWLSFLPLPPVLLHSQPQLARPPSLELVPELGVH